VIWFKNCDLAHAKDKEVNNHDNTDQNYTALIDEATETHQPVVITGKCSNVLLVSEKKGVGSKGMCAYS